MEMNELTRNIEQKDKEINENEFNKEDLNNEEMSQNIQLKE
jgi:hypothetical protein